MSIEAAPGHIVWHDLLTPTVDEASNFYAELLGWDYQIEHANNCTWTSGEADYSLIVTQGVAHGGMVGVERAPSSWLGYVRVEHVDAVTQQAVNLGASIRRPPFDVPGVGRNAVIQDPLGALIGLTTPSHAYPPPVGTFLTDVLVTTDIQSAEQFYTKLLGWQAEDIDSDRQGRYSLLKTGEEPRSVGMIVRSPVNSPSAVWVPILATAHRPAALAQALSLGASPLEDTPNTAAYMILADPTGALFGLSAAPFA